MKEKKKDKKKIKKEALSYDVYRTIPILKCPTVVIMHTARSLKSLSWRKGVK